MVSQPEAADVPASIAGFWQRLIAAIIDGILVGFPLYVIGSVFFEWAVRLGETGRVGGLVIGVLYYGLLNSRLGGGQTPGKRLMQIAVVDRSGAPIGVARSILRYLVLGLPFLLNGVSLPADATGPDSPATLAVGVVLAAVVFGGLGAIVYLYIFNRKTRQSLHDLAVGTFVAQKLTAPIAIEARTPAVHYVVIAIWGLVNLLGFSIAAQEVAPSTMSANAVALRELHAALQAVPEVRSAGVTTVETFMATIRTGGSRTSYLQVAARLRSVPNDPDGLVMKLAAIVLEHHPDLFGKDALTVEMTSGFDLGLASSWSTHRRTHTRAEWLNEMRKRSGAAPVRT